MRTRFLSSRECKSCQVVEQYFNLCLEEITQDHFACDLQLNHLNGKFNLEVFLLHVVVQIMKLA